MLGATDVSTPMVIMITLGDLVTSILTGCFRISTTIVFNTLGEAELTQVWQCPIMWLPIGIFCGVECGCKYTFGFLLLNWIDGQICWLCGPNWPPNSMPLNIFYPTKILSFWSCDRSINVLAISCNSTCLAILALMWKNIKG